MMRGVGLIEISGGECRESGREDEGRDGEKGREVGYTEVKSETEGCEREGGRGCVRGEGC